MSKHVLASWAEPVDSPLGLHGLVASEKQSDDLQFR